ncbi:hypothetical protein [Geoanaerobacter pelophilus]|uniref:hypothetical protein n=1 Tax=Geoanaerobacter pelophilus TaxID=60036 RepID=UPI00117A3FF8|nr:hypothetical protein [Geoanaerobacter pelophilus]
MVLKAKVFTFSAGWGFLASKSDEVEEALNDFIREHRLDEKQIVNVLQSESEGKLLTITFLYKGLLEDEPEKVTTQRYCLRCNAKVAQGANVCQVCEADLL